MRILEAGSQGVNEAKGEQQFTVTQVSISMKQLIPTVDIGSCRDASV